MDGEGAARGSMARDESLTIGNSTFGEEEMGRETRWASKGARGKG